MKLAYLTNRYPAVSHSFIRREIAAIEAMGHDVDRYSVRPPARNLPDDADRRESALTCVILDQGLWALASAALMQFAARPVAWLRTLAFALGGAEPGVLGSVRQLAYFVEACFLARRFAQQPVDHLHVHFGTNPTAVARLCRKLGGPDYSFTVHGPDEFDAPRALDLAGKIADARAAVAISSYGRSQLMRWSDPAHWPRIGVVRCGVDDSFLQDDDAPLPDRPHFCTVSRLGAQKGLPLLIEAAARLRGEGRDFSLTIVGDGELRAQIEQAIARHGLQETIILAGSCDGATVRQHLKAARAFVLPSFAEGLPVVIMEALALRRPVIVTAIAGTPELVDRDCGWLIPAGSVAALADAMREALDAPVEVLRALGEVGRKRVVRDHDARQNAPQLIELLKAADA